MTLPDKIGGLFDTNVWSKPWPFFFPLFHFMMITCVLWV